MPTVPSITSQPPQAQPLLERALLFTLLAHTAAMLSMLILLPGMPGGPTMNVIDRARYVADHPWLWRIGWFPWQITAASDLTLAIALVQTNWIKKLPAILTLLVTLAAIVPDQTSQVRWMWTGTAIAARAIQTANSTPYAELEARLFHLIGGWATVGYIIAALGWTWCFAAARVWSKRLTLLSAIIWPIFIIATALLTLRSPTALLIVSAGNALGFVLLLVWLAEVTEQVLRRSRPNTDHGRFAPWRHPSNGLFFRCIDVVAQSRLAQAIAGLVPAQPMDSDITDTIYINYLVAADQLEKFIIPPLQLQRLGPDNRYALFTFLTFHHGHFGPRCLGPLRKLWPSPIQSNWRIHVYDPLTGKRGIQFLAIAITSTPISLAARLLAENVPMHVPKNATLSRLPSGAMELRIDPGNGTAPDAQATLTFAPEPIMTPPWKNCFATWQDMLAYCVPQDRAMSAQPWLHRIIRQEIALNIPLESCRPMTGAVISRAAAKIAGDAAPLCFLVEKVAFRLGREEIDQH